MNYFRQILVTVVALAAFASQPAARQETKFVSLFNGKDLTGWKIPQGDNVDFLVGYRLHHLQEDHCDDPGPVQRL